MSFKIYPPEPGEIDPKFQMDTRFLYKNLEKIFTSSPVSAIFNTKTSEMFPVNVEEMNARTGIKFKIEEMPVNGIQSFLSNPCVFVAGIENGKLQFSLGNLRSVGAASLACDIPGNAALIQRREDFRVPAPPDRAFKALIFFSIGKEMIADIVDISDQGMQLDLRLGATEMEVGTIWTNCTLERLKARTAPFDLIIQNIRPRPTEPSRIRVGVRLHQPTKLNLIEFVSTRTAIQSSRLNRRINYWYQDTSWC